MVSRTLIATTALVVLLTCACATVSKPNTPCKLPTWPDKPEITAWECSIFDPATNMEQLLICMTNQTVVNLGLWVRDAERYHEAAEVCRGK